MRPLKGCVKARVTYTYIPKTNPRNNILCFLLSCLCHQFFYFMQTKVKKIKSIFKKAVKNNDFLKCN